METINVLVTLPFSDPLIEKLAGVAPRLNVSRQEAQTLEDIADSLETVDVLYTSRVLPDPAQAPRLRWVQLHTASINHILEYPLYTSGEVMFTTSSGIHTVAVAEYVMAHMLAFSHHLPRMAEDQAAANWPENRWERYTCRELRGAVLGLIGYGSIAREVARQAQAFGMQVLAVKRDVRQLADTGYIIPGTGDPEAAIPDRIYPIQALHSFLGECDYVAVTVPLTEETWRLLDGPALARLKPEAVLINVSRGGVVDEKALADALRRGRIAWAVQDVFEQEPLPPDSPLWELPNIVISPHIAGISPHNHERAADLFAENLRRFIVGEPLLNVVDRARGY